MAITDQLKSLYVKLGGDESTSASNVEEWIDKIEDVAGSGSGGASVMYFNAEYKATIVNEEPVFRIEAQVTPEVLLSAVESGALVFLKFIPNNGRGYDIAMITGAHGYDNLYSFDTLYATKHFYASTDDPTTELIVFNE